MKLARPGNLYPHPLLAREGWPFIFAALVITLLATHFFGWSALPLWVVLALIVQFFRDPPREVPNVENAVLSPADGRIVVVEKATLPESEEDALKISVFMNVFNVHSNRAPVSGEVVATQYTPGSCLNASVDKASENNERNAVVIKTDQGIKVVCVQIAGLVARRILCYVGASDYLRAGQRYGFIRFGSRVDVYLPVSATPLVVVGQKVRATSTVLAMLGNAAHHLELTR